MDSLNNRNSFKGNKLLGSEISKSDIERYSDLVDEGRMGSLPTKERVITFSNNEPKIATDYFVLLGLIDGVLTRQDAIEILADKTRILAVIANYVAAQGYSKTQIKRVVKQLNKRIT